MTEWIAAERENRGCNTACTSMSERDGKDQREGSPKLVLVCSPLLISHSSVNPFSEGGGVAAAILHISDVAFYGMLFSLN